MAPGRSGSPGIISSSPVENSATRGRRTTGSSAAPTDAARPSACGVRRAPRCSTALPRRTSSPRRRIHCAVLRQHVRRARCPGPSPGNGLALLLHHDGVGARRHLAAGEDARRRARLQRLAGHAGRDALRHRQHRAGGRHVGRVQRVAVHRRVVLGRHVQRRQHLGRQHAAQRVEGGHRLGLRDGVRRGAGHQAGQRLVQAQQRAGVGVHRQCASM